MCKLSDFSHLKLDNYHALILKNELEAWHEWYLPKDGKLPECIVNGNYAVLDIGAGNGETCQFYLNHDAKHIIAIEPDTYLLKENFGNDPRVTIVQRYVGFIKSDCEGGEREMVVEGGHGKPYRWHLVHVENHSIYNRVWRFEEDWGPFVQKAVRKMGNRLMDFASR